MAMSDRAYERADEVQQLLTETGRHRSAGPVDLLIAATAEREGLIVLCDDRDFQTVASVTGQPDQARRPPVIVPDHKAGTAYGLRPATLIYIYLTMAADQRLSLLALARPRRHRILPVLSQDPPVEHEPKPPRPVRLARGDSRLMARSYSLMRPRTTRRLSYSSERAARG